MPHYVAALSAGVIAIGVLGAGAVLISTPAEAARPSRAEKTALKQAIVACKAEAKGKKIKWLSRRKYVNNCVIEAMKDHARIDVVTLLKHYPNLTKLPLEQWPGF
jgi:hypothetical protein